MRLPWPLASARPERPPAGPVHLLRLILALGATSATPAASFAGWDLQSSPTSANLYDVTASHGNIDVAWACGAEGTILFTSNGGATWIPRESGTTNDLFGIAFHEIGGGPVVAVGAGGTILRTTDQGVTWTPLLSGTTETLRSVSDFGMLIAGDHGTILKGNALGTTWTPMDSGTTADLFSVCGSFRTYAVGESGTILVYQLSVWSPRTSGTTADLFGTPLFGAANYLTGDGGLILHSSNGGVDWSPQAVGATAAFRDIQISSNSTTHLYAVGDAGVIVKTTNAGTTWGVQQSGTAQNLRGVFFYLNNERGWAVGDNGTILRTNDGGGPAVLDVSPAGAGVLSELRISAYPNPFQSRATLVFHLDRPGQVLLDLFDPAGRRIGGWHNEAASTGQQRITLDVDPHLPATVIFARLQTPTGTGESRLLHIP
jgi:photosystem II stability/assembly factor-like uncharacterized protein